jgi:pimeloyl-ACP methyl ester carboxylesterase
MSVRPTVVLVHGAFADASGWSDVVARLHDEGCTAYAPANPLRGLPTDAAYVRAFIDTIEGPVVLVGHSYGGAVISNAATGAPNVAALVYVAAFALDAGESVANATELGGAAGNLIDNIVVRPFPGAAEGDADGYLDPALYPVAFCQDLPPARGAVMAATQRPAALSSLVIPSGEPAWRSIPSWYVVASEDRIIPPAAQRIMGGTRRRHNHRDRLVARGDDELP